MRRQPELFELLRVLVDRPDNRERFLLLSSASPRPIKGVSESRAGRSSRLALLGVHPLDRPILEDDLLLAERPVAHDLEQQQLVGGAGSGLLALITAYLLAKAVILQIQGFLEARQEAVHL